MARQLIKAARASDDTSLPGIDSICRNIYRWERGTVGLTERYKLYYCAALDTSPTTSELDRRSSRRIYPGFPRAR